MKKRCLIFFALFFTLSVSAQKKITDSLYKDLNKAKTDTAKFNALMGLCRYYYIAYPDSAIIAGQQAYDIAEKNNWEGNKARCYVNIASAYGEMGDYVKAMQYYFKSLRMDERLKDNYALALVNNNIGATYIQDQEYQKAIPYLKDAGRQINIMFKTEGMNLKNVRLNTVIIENIGENYLDLHQIDSADYYLKLDYPVSLKNKFDDLSGPIERDLGEIQEVRGDRAGALGYFKKAIAHVVAVEDIENESVAYLSMANLYHKYKQQDSAEYYAKRALDVAASVKLEQDVLNAGKVLYAFYDEDHNLPEAYKYFKLTTTAKDSLYSQDRVKQLLSLDFEEKQHQRDIAEAQVAYQEKVRTYLLVAGLAVLLLIIFIFWRSGKQRKKANRLLKLQKEDIESALEQLQLTQKQLIQSEKMASLGELTAGIAHEIQNPLNFVNNFSEVNIELIDEMEEQLTNGDKEEAIAIATDIKQNLEKIRHHGKRADGIVKGMLQHSRASSNTKEPTDINKLADEYLRLAYHGLRAKDKSFNAELETHFAEGLPAVNIVPQDVGRVFLNLFNNAFYAVQQRQKAEGEGFKPVVKVSTMVKGKFLDVKVEDNGTGIPDAVKDKILQPFFTTKPTGEGTGLGLSLSYDIVAKGHGGKIAVDTKENDHTMFTISLPL